MVRIASWNVNSIKARLENVLSWLDLFAPDIALLQETKVTDENFPRFELEAMGYRCAACGQKAYNGVAILSKLPLAVAETRLPGDPGDEQARYVEAVAETDVGPLRVASIYLPNGNLIASDKFAYKLHWLERLCGHAKTLLAREEPFVIGGDYNVIPRDEDCHDADAWAGDALIAPESRAGLRTLLHLGLTDAFRAKSQEPHVYTFWDYQARAWEMDHGARIDFLLLSPQATDLLGDAGIDRRPRALPKASDHTPVWCALRRN